MTTIAHLTDLDRYSPSFKGKLRWTNTATAGKACFQDSFTKRLSVSRCPILCVQRRSGLEIFAGHIELQYHQEMHCKKLESQSWSKQERMKRWNIKGTTKTIKNNVKKLLLQRHPVAPRANQSCQGTSWVARYWPRSAWSQQRQVQCSFTQRAASSKHQRKHSIYSILIPMFALVSMISLNSSIYKWWGLFRCRLTTLDLPSIQRSRQWMPNVCNPRQREFHFDRCVDYNLEGSWRCFCHVLFFFPSGVKFGSSVSSLLAKNNTGSPARIVWSTIKGKTIENSWSVVASLRLAQDPHAFSILLNATNSTNSTSKRYAVQRSGTHCFKIWMFCLRASGGLRDCKDGIVRVPEESFAFGGSAPSSVSFSAFHEYFAH